MITPHKRKQLYKSLEKMNPTPESVVRLRNHYEIMAIRWIAMAWMIISFGALSIGLYIYWLFDPTALSVAYDRAWILCVASICSFTLSLPLLFVARSNYNAKRRVK